LFLSAYNRIVRTINHFIFSVVGCKHFLQLFSYSRIGLIRNLERFCNNFANLKIFKTVYQDKFWVILAKFGEILPEISRNFDWFWRLLRNLTRNFVPTLLQSVEKIWFLSQVVWVSLLSVWGTENVKYKWYIYAYCITILHNLPVLASRGCIFRLYKELVFRKPYSSATVCRWEKSCRGTVSFAAEH
jgi:hypothetical protein